MVKTICLTMSEDLFAALERAKKQQGYMTNQELINSCIRKFVLSINKNKGGRPKKPDYLDAFSDKTMESEKIEKQLE